MGRSDFEGEFRVGRIARRAPRIETAAGGASNDAATSILFDQFRTEKARADGAILYRRGIAVKVDEARNDFFRAAQQGVQRHDAFHGQIVDDAAGDDTVHHEPVAEAQARGAKNPFAENAGVRLHQ